MKILSTIAMFSAPYLVKAQGLSEVVSRFHVGVTIRDVAEIVVARYSMGEKVCVITASVKMLFVAVLTVELLLVLARLGEAHESCELRFLKTGAKNPNWEIHAHTWNSAHFYLSRHIVEITV